MHDKTKLALIGLICIGFAASGIAATNNTSVSEGFTDQMYWLEKPAWSDRPSYAEDITLQYRATDLIQERATRETCNGEQLLNESSGRFYCNGSMINETVPGESVPVFEISGRNNSYLGNGHVRSNLTVGLNELSTETLKQTTFLLDRSEYIEWFNQHYYYNGSNITDSDVDQLEDKLLSMGAHGSNTRLKASQINSLEVTGLFPFRASADMTMVFRFNDFRSGKFVLSDLISVEVDSSIA